MTDCVAGHAALIYDRGGKRRISELVNLAQIEWGRITSAKSLAKVTISAKNCVGQIERIRNIAARRHELVLYRGDRRSWEGTILQVGWFSDRVEIYAADVKEYTNGRPLTKAWPSAAGGGTDLMTTRVQQILDYELATDYTVTTNDGTVVVPAWENEDPAANVLPNVEVRSSSTLKTTSNTVAFQMSVGEHLDNLAESGLDYTAIGRRLLFWDSAQSIGRTRVVTDADFSGELQVYASGPDFAALAHLAVSTVEEGMEPVVGHAGASDPFYGPWAETGTLDTDTGADAIVQSELNSQAARRIVGRNPVPTQIIVPAGAGILLNETLTIDHLVPGVIMPVRATMNLKPVQQDQRLVEMKVTETAAGETITVTLEAAGTLLEA